MKNSAVTLRLPKKLKTEIEILAKEGHVSVGDIIRESLDQFIAVKKFRQIRRKTLPFAETQGLLTDEDIFKIIS